MSSLVRDHIRDISYSLEQICRIIENCEQEDLGWDGVPKFLDLLPRRYRARNCVVELTAMVWNIRIHLLVLRFADSSV
jgi:hypothetical protein